MIIKNVCLDDIPSWILLSEEYDKYVKGSVSDLSLWYEGNDTLPSFDVYMKSKIQKNEAFMAINDNGECYGIIAISPLRNSITFFGIFHKHDFNTVGEILLEHAISKLDENASIRINELKSNSEHIQKSYTLLDKFGFNYLCDDLEHGVPVNCLERKSNN